MNLNMCRGTGAARGPRRPVLGMVLALMFAGSAQAQNLRGVVTDSATGAPVSGVIVALLDSTDKVARQVITDEKGAFVVVAPRLGTYRVWAMRIGFRPTTTDPMVLKAGFNVLDSLRLRGIALALDTVQVESGTSCGGIGQSDQGLFAAWEQARAALTAVQLTAVLRGVTATVVTYEQSRDPRTRRVVHQKADVTTGFVTQPWGTTPPGLLHRLGYVVTDEEGFVTYHVPGLSALLAETFVQDHCFGIQRTRDHRLVGIDFEPTRERAEIPEVKGTLWLEPKTAELVRLQYRYVNVSAVEENEAGGAMEFARMRDGGWAISRWHVQMPVLEQVIIQGRPVVRMAELRVAGGDLSLATRGGDTLYARARVTVSGTVRDSASDRGIAGARVALQGTTAAATSDADGEFSLDGVLPGAYVVEVHTPAHDAVGDVHEAPIVVANAEEPLEILLGPPKPRFGALAGTVVADSSGRAIAEAEVVFPDLERSRFTDEQGAFVVDSLPPGEHRVVVRKLGFGALDATFTFAAGQRIERRVVLFPAPTLDTVSVVAQSLIPTFDEHRAIGLGTFFTRADLEKLSGRRMSEILVQVRGLRIIQSTGNKSFAATRRRPTTRQGIVRDPQGRESMNAEEGWCYAMVFLDGSKIYEPGNTAQPSSMPAFDVNSISVDQIEAVEYYATQASVPMRYSRGNTTCGVLVIHTRRVERKP